MEDLFRENVRFPISNAELERRWSEVRKAMEAQVAAIRAQFGAEEAEVKKMVDKEKLRKQTVAQERESMAQKRKAD